MRTPAAILGALLLTGCSFLAGGSGEFTVEGTTYRIDKLSCFRSPEGLTITGSANSSSLYVRMTDATRPEVDAVQLGAGDIATLAMGDGEGRMTVQRSDKRFELNGALLHTSDSANAAAGTEEPFTAVIECAEIRDL
ncbi:lipoprotein LpqH [Ammonicoccus fulvus]|uniref:Lipoprotein LpqH n=1 Tax=Ammonicoccus fulvus TaxID=3138240 RepID=A0ABZ3FLF5_9ACTN